MPIADFNRAISKAQEVLHQNYVLEPPVPVDEIAKSYGYEVLEAELPSSNGHEIAGLIDYANSKIIVNKSDPVNRKTFTVAHELGHMLLHKHQFDKDPEKYAILFRQPLGQANSDPIETEANCFAANLLVPREFLNEYKNVDVNTLSKLFGVSKDVIGFRLLDEKRHSSETVSRNT